MKDKRLDALLATLPVLNDPTLKCAYYLSPKRLCSMDRDKKEDVQEYYYFAQCQGDIRKCEREE